MGLLEKIISGIFAIAEEGSSDEFLCPLCGTPMKFNDSELEYFREWECPSCGEVISDEEKREYEDEEENEETIIINELNDIPEGCAACGGDYPNCVDSCPMFDD